MADSELVERIAKTLHDVWRADKVSQGYVWGQTRDDVNKTHPHILEFEEKEPIEQDQDRAIATAMVSANERGLKKEEWPREIHEAWRAWVIKTGQNKPHAKPYDEMFPNGPSAERQKQADAIWDILNP